MITNQIEQKFQLFRMPVTKIDRYAEEGKQIFTSKIEKFVTANEPISFAMLGFPMKSQNVRDKVLGILPDYAEELALNNFEAFNQSVKEVYAPGVNINLISDGYVFNDVLGISDKIVDLYESETRSMSTQAITWYDAKDFYNRSTSLPGVREKITSQFGIDTQELERRILFDPSVNALYNGMIIFMEEEFAMQSFVSKSQQHKAAKKIAREMMFRNEAYGDLVSKEFPDSIRISMHPTTNISKYGFQLIPSPNAFRSPWHCSIFIDDDGIINTVHKKDVPMAKTIYKNNRAWALAN